MKILITEKQFEKFKSEVDEALGVPEGILEVGEKLYDRIIDELKKYTGNIDDLSNEEFEISEEFKISDHIFNKVIFKFDVQKMFNLPKPDMVGMSSENECELTDTLVFKSVRNPQEVVIGFKFFIPEDGDVKDIISYLEKYRKEDISSLTHELQHAFIDVKQKVETLKQRTSYIAPQQMKSLLGFIPEINEFMYNSYFIHAIENVVRPTELAAQLRINNVSKKEFLKFFMDNEIVKRLKEIQNFNYGEFKEKISRPENILLIKHLFKSIGIKYGKKSNEEIVNEFLRLVVVNYTNTKNDLMNKFLTSDFFEEMFGLSGDKDKLFRKYVSQTTKYKDDFESFFRNEEKYFHEVSTMMIKKLSKLYAMLKK